AQSLSDIAAFWAVRDSVSELLHTLGPTVAFDIGLPQRRMDDFVRECIPALDARVGARGLYYGHIGDGNMHILAFVPGLAVQPKEEICDVIYGLVRDYGGTVSAEHGIGTLKLQWLEHARSPEEIALMRTIRTALDPAGILNPGRVF
ncbi:MAG: FAD/FMN-containing dehydrogenase, partial [Paracoccaceae bacterium]